jgi:protein-S-isoprenylcysteine O-methyltransferase Ste14
MNSIINFFMRFTGKNYTPLQRAVSMVPGILIFLIISPFVIFLISRYLGSFIPLHVPRILELIIVAGALLISIPLMTWALVELWSIGNGSPAPIAPTSKLVTTGPYSWCRNPIELGTNIYFLALGIYFDSLVTGIFSLVFGLVLGTVYIKVIEEKEMMLRFGKAYEKYLHTVPFMAFPFLKRKVVI